MDNNGATSLSERDIALLKESYSERAIRKMKENPAVPIGALVTVACLSGAGIRLYQGNSRSFNIWLRGRVVAQTLTACAIAYGIYGLGHGGMVVGGNPDLPNAYEAAARDRAEFDARMQKAEEDHRVEQDMMAERQRNREAKMTPATTGSSWAKLSWFKSSNPPNDSNKS